MISITLLQLFTSLSLELLSGFIDPCHCPNQETLQIDIQNASLVFVGQPLEIKETSKSRETLFSVEELWKGKINIELSVISSKGYCGWNFQPGEKYLVFAYRENDGNYITDKCSRTSLVSNDNQDLKEIRLREAVFPIERLHHCSYGYQVDRFAKCNYIYDPVCGCDGKTYGNACSAYNNGIPTDRSNPCN